MKIRVPVYYKDFKCIAGDCTDTCCAGWEVDVDDASYAYYKTIEGPFGDRLRSVMIDGNKKTEGRFRIRPNGRCPFLNDENLCDLYAELGEDALCVTCDQYPRYTTEFGNLRETGIALSCKTAAALILKEQQNGFTVSEDDLAPSLNNIDAELYFKLMEAREKAFAIISDKSIDIFTRMINLLNFANTTQHDITKKRISTDANISKAQDMLREYFKYYLKQHIIKPEWPALVSEVTAFLNNLNYDLIKKEFDESHKDKDYEYENILYYFTFRYFMKGVFDKDVLSKVKMAVISTIIIHECNIAFWWKHDKILTTTDQIEIVHLYSRELEHSEENFANLCKLFGKKKVFHTDRIIQLLRSGI